jgi:hypothetical protein
MLLEILHIVWRGSLWRASEPSRKTLAGAQVTGLGSRAEIARRHIGNHARAKGCRWCGVLNVHRSVLCQSRQNHLDQQHTPNITKRETNPNSAQRQKKRPIAERFSARALFAKCCALRERLLCIWSAIFIQYGTALLERINQHPHSFVQTPVGTIDDLDIECFEFEARQDRDKIAVVNRCGHQEVRQAG